MGVKLGVKALANVSPENEALKMLDSVLGNFASDAAKFGAGRGAEFVKRLAARDAKGRPANHDLQKSVRRAQLWATWLACRARQNELDAPDKWLQKSIAWIKTAQAELDGPNYQPPELAGFDELVKLADPLQDKSGQADLQVFLNALKERTIAEFGLSDAAGAADNIRNGWNEDGVHFTWETLLYEVFNEAYKTDPRTQAALLKLLLYRRDEQTDAVVELSAAELQKIHAPMQAALDGLGQKLLAKLDEIAGRLQSVEGKQDFLLGLFMDWRSEMAQRDDALREELKAMRQEFGAKLDKLSSQPRYDPYAPRQVVALPRLEQEIVDREDEWRALARALSEARGGAVLSIVAPGGFGKSAVLEKAMRAVTDGEKILPEYAATAQAIVYCDCREDGFGMRRLFGLLGETLGLSQHLQEIYDQYANLPPELRAENWPGALHTLFTFMRPAGAVWVLLDNFEAQLTEQSHQLAGAEWETLLGGAESHNLRLLVVSRFKPVLAGRRALPPVRVDGATIGERLLDGLPLADARRHLRNLGSECGLADPQETPDALLDEFANRVHRIPLALTSVANYLNGHHGITLSELLRDNDLFADFDNDDAELGLKKLLRLQIESFLRKKPEAKPFLCALAFFPRPLPAYALELLFPEEQLKIATRKMGLPAEMLSGLPSKRAETAQLLSRLLDDNLVLYDKAAQTYRLHQLVAETVRVVAPDYAAPFGESLAKVFHAVAVERYQKAVLRPAELLWECEAAIYQALDQPELANDLARALINKAVAVGDLYGEAEALPLYDRAIDIRDELVKAGRAELANDLAAALMNKAVALRSLGRGVEALAFYDRAIDILDELVTAGRAELANDLATALANRAIAWGSAEEWDKSLADYAAAIGWRAALVEQAGRSELLPELVKNYWCRLDVLLKLERWPEAAADAWTAWELTAQALGNANLHEAVKEATAREFAQAVKLLRQLTPEQSELIYAALTHAQAATLREAVGE
jgi:hypothetical protein